MPLLLRVQFTVYRRKIQTLSTCVEDKKLMVRNKIKTDLFAHLLSTFRGNAAIKLISNPDVAFALSFVPVDHDVGKWPGQGPSTCPIRK